MKKCRNKCSDSETHIDFETNVGHQQKSRNYLITLTSNFFLGILTTRNFETSIAN